jgi:hypothetical protein
MVCNEHHNAEVTSAREVADEEVANNTADILAQIQSEFTICSTSCPLYLSRMHVHLRDWNFK